ncbi:hypothetical protein E2C01_063934 [Portunus trituberculatus]|uniref:Uncharacterized protein n=1 Tax=Portunus trituberculatus TaxID=210409 RepID=A0A5B7HHS1_PORTR|nr:hypothetical protein [Portunus trituberculatus]
MKRKNNEKRNRKERNKRDRNRRNRKEAGRKSRKVNKEGMGEGKAARKLSRTQEHDHDDYSRNGLCRLRVLSVSYPDTSVLEE